MRSLPLAVLVLGGIVALGVLVGSVAAIAVATLIAAVFAGIAWWSGPRIVAWRLGARPFAGGEPSRLVRALAAVRSVGEREVTVLRVDSQMPNAVVLGDGRVAASDGLLQTLDEDELQAVLRHLYARSGSRSGAAVAVLLLPVVFAAALLKSVIMVAAAFSTQSEVDDHGSSEAQSIGPVIAGVVVGPFARLLLWLGTGRGVVWAADDAASQLAQQRETLIRVLERVDRVSQPPIVFRAARYSLISLFWNHLFFVSPLDHTPLQRFAALPSARARIDRLGDPHHRAS